MADTIINSATTLSLRTSPGENLRFPTTSSESIFTFGDFSVQKNLTSDTLTPIIGNKNFSTFSTLDNISSNVPFDAHTVITTTINDLNPQTNNPQSYAYFSSFYTKIATAINNIIANYPFAILDYQGGTGNTVFNYTQDIFNNTSSFNVPISGLTNPGGVIFASGHSNNDSIITIFNNTNQFGIQLSGNTANTQTYNILNYSYTSGSTGILTFTISGILFNSTTTASTVPIFIRPTPQRFGAYKRSLSNLEHQLLFEGKFLIPDVDDDSLFTNTSFPWPRTDGFNIDSFGTAFELYKTIILNSAIKVDDTKTNWMIRTMIPENYLDLDTDTQIYQKLITTYATEFDTIKQYIDSIAFAHSVSYNNQENIPNKFLYKLSDLLGFKFSNAFNDVDIFEYLAGEDDAGKTFEDYNIELWKRILVNINWIYKSKGTRNAIEFMFKLIGAPDCLVHFDEFVYKINKTVLDEKNLDPFSTPKINSDGFPDYNQNPFVFQEGSNGVDFIKQWEPEFQPELSVDNRKVMTGDTGTTGTQNIINTKEIKATISPSQAIECDVQEWYNLGFGVWDWGMTGITFSGLTVPFEDVPENIDFSIVTALTISQWIDYVYATAIDPRDRKTTGKGAGHNFIYKNLKNIYLNYMLWTNNQNSNRLTFAKLEKFLTLIERNFHDYLPQLLPATTILDAQGTTYKNTVFNRQKFVYPEGKNSGSEFQRKLPLALEEILPAFDLKPTINNNLGEVLPAFDLKPIINNNLGEVLPAFELIAIFTNNLSLNINASDTIGIIRKEKTSTKTKFNIFHGTIINYPANGIA